MFPEIPWPTSVHHQRAKSNRQWVIYIASLLGMVLSATPMSTTSVSDRLGSWSPIAVRSSVLSAIHTSPTYPLHLNFNLNTNRTSNLKIKIRERLNDQSVCSSASRCLLGCAGDWVEILANESGCITLNREDIHLCEYWLRQCGYLV